MKKITKFKNLLFFVLLLTSISTYAQTKTIMPESAFDKGLALTMLKEGTATINGVASTKQKNTYGLNAAANATHFAPRGSVVTLFPMTPYFKEFLKLRKKNKKQSVYLSEEALKYRLEAKTDEFGYFQFTKMKPGKYYIECIVSFAATGANVVQTGTSTLYNTNNGQALSSSPVYEKFFYNYDFANRESQIVELTKDGEILNIKL